ncbi:MAG TPA: heavy metal translocating P-type ATPase [Terracidiphilus sp.]|nr:heavy metal translocating P-type ATPase [Terracidiphilus sp.]
MTPSASESLTLPVLGMTCASCQHHVEEALRATAGVESAHVDLMAHRASVVFDPAMAAPEQLVEAIRGAGYDAVLPRADDAAGAENRERTAESARKAWVTLATGAAAMLLAMPLGSHMGALDHAPDRVLMWMLPWLYALPANELRWFLLVLTAAVVGWAGRGIYMSAIRALRHGATNMNTLVGLGTSVAFVYSAYATLWPAPGRNVYFDAVLLIIGFLLLGKSLEGRAKRRALAALDSLSRLRPVTARRIVDGVQTLVPLEEIRPGDDVLVLPGERFPVDATIVEGRTSVDESMLTGESTPLAREVGGRVLAGSLNYDGAVVCRAESLGEATVLAQITRMVEQAQGSRAPMERLADRASSIFVPVVLGLAVLTFVAWLLAAHSLSLALENTVAVLVIACPCAMGLAVPAALTVAVGRGAQLGVLFKGGEALERLAHLDAIVLDKTGTLTVGRPVLAAVHGLAGQQDNDLLRMAAAAEERSNHPLAHAIVDFALGLGLTWKPAEDVQIIPGRGLTARVEEHDCLLGNEALFQESFISLPDGIAPPEAGVTRLWMALDNLPVGYFDARDALRPDAAEAIAELRQAGLQVLMLTGDSKVAALSIANQAGITEVEAELDPAGKLARIRALQQSGLRVAMVGDGINDAAALAQADAGIAMGTGADLAQEAGDVLLLRTQPSAIPAALGLARQTLRIMRQNLGWAVGYNLLGIPLAAGLLYPAFHILLTPWLAAAAMALSSVCVLGNSLRLRRWSSPKVSKSQHEAPASPAGTPAS